MKAQKIGRLRFYWIAFMTGVFTFYYSVAVILGSFAGSRNRQIVDRSLYRWATRLLNLVKVEIVTEGLEKMPQAVDRPIIVMCNHSSLYDIPVSAVALKTSLRMLTKKELFNIPVFSTALRRGEFVSVDRHNRAQSIKDLALAKKKMLDGIILWAAPEGTRSQDGKLAQFKRGAFHIAIDTEALIVPLVIKDIHKVQDGKDLSLTIGRKVHVEVCEAIDAKSYGIENRRKLVKDVRFAMLKALDQVEDTD